MGKSDATHRLAFLAVVFLLVFSGLWQPAHQLVSAQSGGDYDLSWNTIDGGGVTSASGGTYRLAGTIGQSDAGVLSGGRYTLKGGFWAVGKLLLSRVYLPLVVRTVP